VPLGRALLSSCAGSSGALAQTGIIIAVLFSLGLFIALNTRPRIEVLGRVRGALP
jgi:hypothetical protein